MVLKNRSKKLIFELIIIVLYFTSGMILKNLLKNSFRNYDNIVLYLFLKNVVLSIVFVFFSLFFLKNDRNDRTFFKIVVITVSAFVFMEVIRNFMINNLIRYLFSFESQTAISAISTINGSYLYIVDLVIFTPIVEEMVFRKAFFGGLYNLHDGCNRYLKFITAFLVSGIFFCSIHDGIFVPSSISYLFGSLVYSLLYLHTKSIIPSIVVHGAHNLVFVAMVLL